MSGLMQAIVAGAVLLSAALLVSAVLLARSLAGTRAELARLHARLDAQSGDRSGGLRPTQAPTLPVPVVTDLGRVPADRPDSSAALVPTPHQVVQATMQQPLVRVAVWSAGVRHALRPESRDRARALARRELRRRSKVRRRATRHAARTTAVSTQWPDESDVGERAS